MAGFWFLEWCFTHGGWQLKCLEAVELINHVGEFLEHKQHWSVLKEFSSWAGSESRQEELVNFYNTSWNCDKMCACSHAIAFTWEYHTKAEPLKIPQVPPPGAGFDFSTRMELPLKLPPSLNRGQGQSGGEVQIIANINNDSTDSKTLYNVFVCSCANATCFCNWFCLWKDQCQSQTIVEHIGISNALRHYIHRYCLSRIIELMFFWKQVFDSQKRPNGRVFRSS